MVRLSCAFQLQKRNLFGETALENCYFYFALLCIHSKKMTDRPNISTERISTESVWSWSNKSFGIKLPVFENWAQPCKSYLTE